MDKLSEIERLNRVVRTLTEVINDSDKRARQEIEQLKKTIEQLKEWYKNIDVLPSADGLEAWTREAFEKIINGIK